MSYPVTWYSEGTVEVSNGYALVTGTGTSWTTNARRGDFFVHAGVFYVIEEVTDNAHLNLERPFEGSNGSGEPYLLCRGLNWLANAAVAMAVNALIQSIAAKGLIIPIDDEELDGDDPDTSIGGDGDVAVLEGPPHRIWIKASGAWIELTAGLGRPVTLVGNANYSPASADHDTLLVFDLTSTNRTVTLPELSAVFPGYRVRIKLNTTSTATLTVNRSGSDAFGDGSTSKEITVAGGFLYIVAADDWYIEGIALAALSQGDPGPTGPAGLDGIDGGLNYKFSTSTTMGENPGAGILRFNDADPTAVTACTINNMTNDSGTPNVGSLLNALTESTNATKAIMVVWKRSAKQNFASYAITARAGPSGYKAFTLTYIDHEGSFSANDVLSVQIIGPIPAGTPGATGATGPARAMTGTSSTSLAIGTGDKTFATQASIGWSVGTRLRAASAANVANYMEGTVTAYSGTSLTISVDRVGGSGTFADWQIGIIGEVGDTGPAGSTGETGAQGVAGPSGSDAGYPMLFDDGTADEDPGSGMLRANNADLSAAAELYISKTSNGGDDIESFLLGFAGPTNTVKGHITLRNVGELSAASFNVTGVTDATDYVKVAVADHAGATAFSDEDPLSFQWSRAGDAGDDGDDGDDGADGVDPGFLLTWDDGTSGDPGTGAIGADNADLSAATAIRVSKTSRGGSVIETALLGYGAGTSDVIAKMLLTTQDEKHISYNVTAVADETGYVVFTVTAHSGETSLTDADPVSLQLSATGDAGTPVNIGDLADVDLAQTWTPVLAGATTPGDYDLTIALAQYWKIGPLVYVLFDFTVNAVNEAGSGAALVSGLPIPHSATLAAGGRFSDVDNIAGSPSNFGEWVLRMRATNVNAFNIVYQNTSTKEMSSITITDLAQASTKLTGWLLYIDGS